MRQVVSTPACDEADIFARELMMPHKSIYEWCLKLNKAGIDKYDYAQYISKLFGVPHKQASIRLKELKVLS